MYNGPVGEEALFDRAIAGDPEAVRALVTALVPVVQLRVARALARRETTRAQGREVVHETYDLVQEVFESLFAHDARVLRSWNRDRGLSLKNFVGLVAEHRVATIFRSGKKRPWSDDVVLSDDLTIHPSGTDEEGNHAAKDLYAKVLDRVRASLGPRALGLFHALVIEERPVESVVAETGLSKDAIYQWRSRLLSLVRDTIVELDPERGKLP